MTATRMIPFAVSIELAFAPGTTREEAKRIVRRVLRTTPPGKINAPGLWQEHDGMIEELIREVIEEG